MNPNLKTLRFKMPGLSHRIVPIEDPHLRSYTESNMEVVSSEILKDETYHYSKKLHDYAPFKYRKILLAEYAELKLNVMQDRDLKRFREEIKSLLPKESFCNDSVLEIQVDTILARLAKHKNTHSTRYRAYARRQALDFYPKMSSFLKAKYDVQEKSAIVIGYGKLQKENFVLPAPRGIQHLITSLNTFFLKYYSDNQPTKSYHTYTEELVFNNHYRIKQGEINIDEKLIEKFHYNFHLDVLQVIKSFPQIKHSQRPSMFSVSKDQAEFIVKLAHLINFHSWYKQRYAYITPNFKPYPTEKLKKATGSLRAELVDYQRRYKNASFYTI